MLMRPFLRAGLLALLLFPGVHPAGAADLATIPYAKLDEIWQKTDAIDRKKLIVLAQFGSSNKAVKPSDIVLSIRSSSGAIPIRLSPEGDVLDFPRTEALRKENPPIETNQPKGTLALGMSLGVVVPDSLTFRYARIAEGLAEGNKAVKAQAGMLSLVAPSLKCVVFFFPPPGAGKATVEIAAAGGKKVLTADASGQVKLMLGSKITAENPEVRVSERPTRILLSP